MTSRDEAHFAAVGRVAQAAAHLEMSLTAMLAVALDAGRIGLVVIAGERLPWTVAKLEAMAGLRPGAEREALRTTLVHAKRVYERRNQVLHATWVPDGSDSDVRQRFKFSHGKATVASGDRMAVDELNELAEEIGGVAMQVALQMSFVRTIGSDPELRRQTNLVGESEHGAFTVGPPE